MEEKIRQKCEELVKQLAYDSKKASEAEDIWDLDSYESHIDAYNENAVKLQMLCSELYKYGFCDNENAELEAYLNRIQ